MVTKLLQTIIELSNQLIVTIDQVDLSNDESEKQLDPLQLARDLAIKQLFEQHSLESLQPHNTLLQQVVDLDSQLQQLAKTKKSTMAKAVIKQRKNTKATSAYLGK